ncbi:hypothetical protein [Massilia sp. S19_KUP03_FR1]|uniref:hypothetical protein n=1 Tax=Massilia sp. S19_KUP03_FR1 TaxID=3025503 RepID=UPI002FCD90BB
MTEKTTVSDRISCCKIAQFSERTLLVVIIKRQHVSNRHPFPYTKDQNMKKLFATVAILSMISAPVFAQSTAPAAAGSAAPAAPAAAGTAAAGTGFGVAGLSTAAMVGIGAAVAAVAVVASDNNSTTTHH